MSKQKAYSLNTIIVSAVGTGYFPSNIDWYSIEARTILNDDNLNVLPSQQAIGMFQNLTPVTGTEAIPNKIDRKKRRRERRQMLVSHSGLWGRVRWLSDAYLKRAMPISFQVFPHINEVINVPDSELQENAVRCITNVYRERHPTPDLYFEKPDRILIALEPLHDRIGINWAMMPPDMQRIYQDYLRRRGVPFFIGDDANSAFPDCRTAIERATETIATCSISEELPSGIDLHQEQSSLRTPVTAYREVNPESGYPHGMLLWHTPVLVSNVSDNMPHLYLEQNDFEELFEESMVWIPLSEAYAAARQGHAVLHPVIIGGIPRMLFIADGVHLQDGHLVWPTEVYQESFDSVPLPDLPPNQT